MMSWWHTYPYPMSAAWIGIEHGPARTTTDQSPIMLRTFKD